MYATTAPHPDSIRPPKPGPQVIHHEWRTASNSAAYLLPTLNSMKDSNPSLNLLDIGAGSGTISITFAKAIPSGHVTATDVNPSILMRASEIATSEGVTNISFQTADAYKIPFPDETFDVTHCHQVLCHLKEPWDVLCEMLRVTKKGGIVAARESDQEMECVWPELPGLLKFHELVGNMMRSGGGHSNAGRQLLAWALKAGVERKQVTATFGNWCYVDAEDKKAWAQGMIQMLQGGRMHDRVLGAELATEDDLEKIANSWKEWREMDDATLAMLQGEIIIRK